jgi:hypothetical protein
LKFFKRHLQPSFCYTAFADTIVTLWPTLEDMLVLTRDGHKDFLIQKFRQKKSHTSTHSLFAFSGGLLSLSFCKRYSICILENRQAWPGASAIKQERFQEMSAKGPWVWEKMGETFAEGWAKLLQQKIQVLLKWNS